ncbi:MAG: AMP-dependent synthetase [Desulfobulbaceae bacterium]|nr:MAG: AMP-dependent synthetase [Desulfobulbaceae bacterium]
MTGEFDTLQGLVANLPGRGEQCALALVEAQTVREWSYRRLASKVDGVAMALLESGLRPGDHVGLLGKNRAQWVIAALAVLRVGAVIMPLDTQTGETGLAHIIVDSGARFFFIDDDQARRFAKLDKAENLHLMSLAELPTSSTPLAAITARRPEDPAALFYTSGTTGPPKGVPLSHANLAFQINTVSVVGLMTATDRVLLPLPLHHVYPLVIGLLVPLGMGLPLIMPDELIGPRILRAIRVGKTTTLIGVPRLYQALYQGIEDKAAAGGRLAGWYFKAALSLSMTLRRRFDWRLGKVLLRPLHRRFGPSLRLLASGGSALDAALALKLEALGWQVAVGYGLTETSPLLTINPPLSGRAGSVGQPVPGVTLQIDPTREQKSAPAAALEPGADDGASSPVSSPVSSPASSPVSSPASPHGEVLARGASVFAGYWNLPERSAAAFSAGWFHTGDLGYLDPDGFLFLTGRASTLIVTAGGKNIQPEPLEDILATHPFISEAGVLSYREKLAALLIPNMGALRQAKEHDIKAALRQALLAVSRDLPSYQRPDEYAIARESLPRTRLGKIQRHLLGQRYEQARAATEQGHAAGATPLSEMSDHDRTLLEVPSARAVWAWLARRYPQAHLSPDSSPHLDLGIDSLDWLSLTMEIGRHANVELSEEAIGRIETVRDLLIEVVHLTEHGREFNPIDPLENPEAVLSPEQRHWLTPLNRFQVALAWGLYQFNRLLFRVFFRLRFDGRENLPAGPLVLAPNHVSFLDPFALAAALPFKFMRRTWFAGLQNVAFSNVFFRLVCRLGQVVPIDPRRAAASSLAYGSTILGQGHNLVWFAEGERSFSGQPNNFRPGIGVILDRHRVFVVPIHIGGAYEAWPRHKLWPRLRPIKIKFGPAVDANRLAAELATTSAPIKGGAGVSSRITAALQQKVATLADTNGL